MEGIIIGKAISDYGIVIITAILLVLAIWLIKHYVNQQTEDRKVLIKQQIEDRRVFVNQQTEDRKTLMSIIQNELKLLHKDNLTNARLNRQSITMLGKLTEYFNRNFNGSNDRLNLKKKINEKG